MVYFLLLRFSEFDLKSNLGEIFREHCENPVRREVFAELFSQKSMPHDFERLKLFWLGIRLPFPIEEKYEI